MKTRKFSKHVFSSGSTKGPDFLSFARAYKKDIAEQLEPFGIEIFSWSTGHYYCSGFFKRGDCFVYFSCSDVRFFPGDWEKKILIRTAKNERDYTGGPNCYSALADIGSKANKLFGEIREREIIENFKNRGIQ